MEEDIKHLEKRIDLNRQMYLEFGRLLSLDEETVNAIENLINKNKEQEQIIELMADYIDVYGECVNGSKKNCEEPHCQKCIIDYFTKKARGE